MTGMSGPRLMSVGRSEAYHRLYWLPVGIQDCLLSPAGPRRSLTFRREHSSCLSAQRRRFASPGSTNTLRNTLKSVMKLGVPPQSRRSGHSSTVATGELSFRRAVRGAGARHGTAPDRSETFDTRVCCLLAAAPEYAASVAVHAVLHPVYKCCGCCMGVRQQASLVTKSMYL